ncbi:MAG: hypothetical protein WC059_02660 [Candidatus Paceibacterota bacterium]
MNRENIKSGLFLLWNYAGGMVSSPFSEPVKVLETEAKNVFGKDCFVVYRLADNVVLDINYSRAEEFTILPENEKEKLTLILKEIASSKRFKEMINSCRNEYEFMQKIITI